MAEFLARFRVSEAEALIAFASLLTGLLMGGLTAFFSMRANQREARGEIAAAYLSLETHSSAIFQFEAENADIMQPVRGNKRPARLPSGKALDTAKNVTEQLYFQSLNLFEVAANFRKQEIVNHEVFASWVAWFYELLNDWYFRDIWEDIRSNYTTDIRAIFDIGMLIYAHEGFSEAQKLRAFYDGVSQALGGCEDVENWLDYCNDRSTETNWFATYIAGRTMKDGSWHARLANRSSTLLGQVR